MKTYNESDPLAVKEISITEDWLIKVGHQKKIFCGALFLSIAVVISALLLLPKYFTATTVLLPPQSQQSSAAGALAQLGALAGVAGAGGATKTPDELYVALFKTRRLRDVLIKNLGLESHYGCENLECARRILDLRVSITTDKRAGLISISVDDVNAELSSKIANGHVNEIRDILEKVAVTEAQQRKAFYEIQVNQARTSLDHAEAVFRREQKNNGMIVSQALAESGVKSGVELRRLIVEKEVQISALTRFTTEKNYVYQRLLAELGGLKAQLKLVEEGTQEKYSENSAGMSAVKAFRELKTREASLEALGRQLEIAKIDEAKDPPLIQQIDIAEPPLTPSKPSKILILLGGVIFSILFSFFAALTVAMLRQWAQGSVGLREIRSAWKVKATHA